MSEATAPVLETAPEVDNRRAYHRDVVDLRDRVQDVAERLSTYEAAKPEMDYARFARDCVIAHIGNGGAKIKYLHQLVPAAWRELQRTVENGPGGTAPMTVSQITGLEP